MGEDRDKILLPIWKASKILKVTKETLCNYLSLGAPSSHIKGKNCVNLEEIKNWLESRQKSRMNLAPVPGDKLLRREIEDYFKCQHYRGMAQNTEKKIMVLFSDRTGNNPYQDYEDDGIIYYTGEGLTGDQNLTGANKILAESNSNDYSIYLAEAYQPGLFIFRGKVKLADNPYLDKEKDSSGDDRKVYKFPLKLMTPNNFIAEEDILGRDQKMKEQASGLSDEELYEKIAMASIKSVTSTVKAIYRSRNPHIKEYALRRANGVCELCHFPGPFDDKKKGRKFLETHHLIPLAEGGNDSIDNVVALCPNCHRKMHYLSLEEDKKRLESKLETIKNRSLTNLR